MKNKSRVHITDAAAWSMFAQINKHRNENSESSAMKPKKAILSPCSQCWSSGQITTNRNTECDSVQSDLSHPVEGDRSIQQAAGLFYKLQNSSAA